MSVRVTVDRRSERVLIDLGEHRDYFHDGINTALYQIGRIAQQEIRRILDTGPKTGRIYRRPDGRSHQASAPGQAPATETGALSRSVDYEVNGRVSLEVGDREPYGLYLENGTRGREGPGGSRVGQIRPRPHVVVGANNTAGAAVRILEDSVADIIGRGRR